MTQFLIQNSEFNKDRMLIKLVRQVQELKKKQAKCCCKQTDAFDNKYFLKCKSQ